MNKYAIVTGAASGLGLETIKLLLDQEFHVSAWDQNLISVEHERLEKHQVDLSSSESINKALMLTLKNFKSISVLVNAAGISLIMPFIGSKFVHKLNEFEKVLRVNLTGTFDVCRQVGQYMNGGVIINVASICATQSYKYTVAYAASKGAILSLTMPMSRDLSFKNIRVVCISPGAFSTPMTDTMKPEAKSLFTKAIPQGRFGEASEFSNSVLFAINNSYLNGCNIELNGGLVVPNI